MVTVDEEIQAKELLSRAEIKTMKKDLQKLREGIALKEREKIVGIKTPEEEKKIEREKLEKLQQQEELEKQTQLRTDILQKETEGEKEAMAQLKDYANEEEKQKIFYLESEKVKLENQLQVFQKEKESPLLLQKNKFLLERNAIEERLKLAIEEEKKIEDEQNLISEKEGATNVPSDKQRLEKRRWELEEKRKEMEKNRWVIEKDLEKTESQIKTINDEYQKLLEEEKTLKDKIAEISNSLKEIYARIMEREEERKRAEKEQRDVESLKRAESESKRKEEIRREEWRGRGNIEEKPFLQGVPPGGKKENFVKKMQETSEKEGEERKRFLENVEKWAKEDKK